MHTISKTLLILATTYFLAFVISFSTFVQAPIYPDLTLTWQGVIEQLTIWIPVVFSFLYLIKVVLDLKLKKDTKIIRKQELSYLFIGLFLLFTMGFSSGIHAAAQIIQDAISYQVGTNLYNLTWILDEYLGHFFLVLYSFLLILLSHLELNRKPQQTNSIDLRINEGVGVLNGALWAVAGIEGGSMYLLMIPISILGGFQIIGKLKFNNLELKNHLVTRYLFISLSVFCLLVLYWILNNGFTTQLTNRGFELFSM